MLTYVIVKIAPDRIDQAQELLNSYAAEGYVVHSVFTSAQGVFALLELLERPAPGELEVDGAAPRKTRK